MIESFFVCRHENERESTGKKRVGSNQTSSDQSGGKLLLNLENQPEVPGKTMSEWHECEVRVRYAETDKMGIVHHSNYLVWFEFARSEYCRARGFSYKEMEERDRALLVVAEAYCRYKSPAFYEDVLTIRSKVSDIRSRSLRFAYQVYRPSDATLLAEGETLHVVTDENKRVRIMPDNYRKMLTAELGEKTADN
jgi:acyl-CoA thioester hydrolase